MIDEYIQNVMTKKQIPGMSVAVVKEGETVRVCMCICACIRMCVYMYVAAAPPGKL